MSDYAQRFVENDIDVSVLPHLTEQDLKETDDRFREVAVSGQRYSPEMMALLQQ